MGSFDKRKNPRLQFVDVTYVSNKEGTIRGSVFDISLTGIGFCTDKKIENGTVVEVNINYNPINFLQKAHVVWSKKRDDGTYEHGAEFINVPKERKLLLEEHIEDIMQIIGYQEEDE